MRKLKLSSFLLGAVILTLFVFFFVGFPQKQEVTWGVNFSQKHAEGVGLDWKELYTALLEDMEVRNFKIAVHWDQLEPAKDAFSFADLDWQMQKAKEKEATVTLVVGMKTPRWPECHVPSWAGEYSKEEQQQEIREYIEAVVERYKDSMALYSWQVENEPFFDFGLCPWRDTDFLKEEIEIVHSLDSVHPVIVTESGEFSLWNKAASYGDIVGVTLYRKVWFGEFNSYVSYPHTSTTYSRRAQLINTFFGKEVIGIELQAEPWGPSPWKELSIEEQAKTMNTERFANTIEFAQRTGLPRFYLWGAEWWYWMKETKGDAAMWERAKGLFES